MEISQQHKLAFIGVDIIKVDYECDKSYNFEEKIDLNIDVSLLPKNPSDPKDEFGIGMHLNLQVESYFKLEVTSVGHFKLEVENEQDDAKMKEIFINSSAPAIMFPYLRSFISTFSANTGRALPHLNIPPQYFKGKLQQEEESD